MVAITLKMRFQWPQLALGAVVAILGTASPAAAQSARQQGDRIAIGSRTLSVPWAQWQQGGNARIGIGDTAARQLGIELAGTDDPQRQAVRWFEASLTLKARRQETQRYLALNRLFERTGASTRVQGQTLRIEPPKARLEGIRRGQHPWGERIVLDLSRPTFWHWRVRDGTATVTVAATAAAQLQARDSEVTAVKAAGQDAAQLQFDIPAGLVPQVQTLRDPARIAIDFRPRSLQQREIRWAPGVSWHQDTITAGDTRFPAVWLSLDPARVSLRPIQAEDAGMQGIAPLAQMARQQGATAAINGGFFNRNSQLPLGAIRRDGRWLSGPILDRGAFAWNERGQGTIARLRRRETLILEGGPSWPVPLLNTGYTQSGIARYTPAWGQTYTPMTDGETVAVVRDGRIVRRASSLRAGERAFDIPANGYVLAVRGSDSEGAASALTRGKAVSLRAQTSPAAFADYPHVLGAGPLLLQDGRTVLDARAENFSQPFRNQAAPRSAIGIGNSGSLIVATFYGQKSDGGPTLAQTAQLMQRLGAQSALNLDGGNSSALYLGGQLLDPPPAVAGRVHNGLGIFLQRDRAR